MEAQILAQIVTGAKNMVQADSAAIRLLNQGGTHLTVMAVSGMRPDSVEQESMPLERCPLDQDALAGYLVTVTDVASDPRTAHLANVCHTLICIPLIDREMPLGTIQVYSTTPRRFGEREKRQLTLMANLGAVAIKAARKLKKLDKQRENQDQFINVVTHELRSPITVSQSLIRGVIKGYAGKMSEGQESIFNRVSHNLDNLESLVNDLLDMAVSRTSDLLTKKEPVSLNVSIGQAVLSLQPRADEKNVTLRYHKHPNELIILGSNEGMERIFTNLVGNAVKYTPPGGKVEVLVEDRGDEIQVEVTDTGIGIPEEAIPHLFDEFYRAPNAKKSGEVGTGLGLNIVKDLVQAYGGTIEVNSKIDKGTTFTVTFPEVED